MIDYVILSANTVEELEKHVNTMASKNYLPTGGAVYDPTKGNWCQALYMPGKPKSGEFRARVVG